MQPSHRNAFIKNVSFFCVVYVERKIVARLRNNLVWISKNLQLVMFTGVLYRYRTGLVYG